MKKLLAFALVAASFVACNETKTDKTTTKDSSIVVTPDTSVIVKETTVTVDTLHKSDVKSDVKVDTMKKK